MLRSAWWSFSDVTQRMVVISYRSFGTAYPPHFQRKQFSTFEDGTDSLSLNLVNNYHHTLRNITEDRRSLLLCPSTHWNRHCTEFYKTQNSSKEYTKVFYTDVQLNPPRNTIIAGRNSFGQLYKVCQATVPVCSKFKTKETLYCIPRKLVKKFCHWYLVTDSRTDVVSTRGCFFLLSQNA